LVFRSKIAVQIQLDDNVIEQVGIKPDIEVPYPITHVMKEDPQIKEGIKSLYNITGN